MSDDRRVSFSFSGPWRGKIFPLVHMVCAFPKNVRGLGHCGPIHTWALEYHSKNAGRVYFGGFSGKYLYREAGTIHLYAPRCDYWEDCAEADLPIRETYWIFDGGDIAGLERFVDNPERFACFRDPENLVGSLMMESAAACESRGQDAFWMVQSLFAKALFLLFGSRRIDAWRHLISSEAPRPTFSFEVERYLRENLAENLTLADIARHARTSASSLSHRFKQETGVSPIAKLIEVRIERAKGLLLKGEKLKTIAAVTGHSSEYHLSRNFKAVVGVSPAEFRGRSRQTLASDAS